MEKHAIDDTKDRGRAGDPERERNERCESKPGIFQQHPNAVAKIVEKRVHNARSPSLFSSFPNSVWEWNCPGNSVAPPAKRSFEDKGVPKQSLGTRSGGIARFIFIQPATPRSD